MKTKHWIIVWVVVAILAFCTGRVMASVDMDSGTFIAHYTEPTASVGGTPLSDLDYTTIYYRLDNVARIKVRDIPATSVNGGGVIGESFTIEGLNGKEVDVIIIYSATDLSGNESAEFVEPTIRIDQLAPVAPQG